MLLQCLFLDCILGPGISYRLILLQDVHKLLLQVCSDLILDPLILELLQAEPFALFFHALFLSFTRQFPLVYIFLDLLHQLALLLLLGLRDTFTLFLTLSHPEDRRLLSQTDHL